MQVAFSVYICKTLKITNNAVALQCSILAVLHLPIMTLHDGVKNVRTNVQVRELKFFPLFGPCINFEKARGTASGKSSCRHFYNGANESALSNVLNQRSQGTMMCPGQQNVASSSILLKHLHLQLPFLFTPSNCNREHVGTFSLGSNSPLLTRSKEEENPSANTHPCYYRYPEQLKPAARVKLLTRMHALTLLPLLATGWHAERVHRCQKGRETRAQRGSRV